MIEKVIAIGLVLPKLTRSVAEEHLEELTKLIETAGGTVVEKVFAKRPKPDPASFIGSGKAEELKQLAKHHGATLVVFDDDLTPAQRPATWSSFSAAGSRPQRSASRYLRPSRAQASRGLRRAGAARVHGQRLTGRDASFPSGRRGGRWGKAWRR